jgi:F0F1-type ATP synthase delta subunit
MQRISRRRVAQSVAEQLLAGQDRQQVLRRLGAYLVETHQTDQVDRYARDIEYECARAGVVVADVVTARPLSSVVRQAVESFVRAHDGGQVVVREHIDQAVLGGVAITTPLRHLDATLASRLRRLKIANQGDMK